MKITFQQKALLARTVRHMFSAGSEDMNNLQLVKRSSTSSTDHKVPSAGCSVCLGDCDPDVSSAKLLDGRSSVASCSSQQRYGDQRNLHTCTSSTQHLSYRHPSYCHLKMSSSTLNGNGQDLKRFLEEVGTNAKEARFWLRHFQRATEPLHPFAVIQLDPEVFHDPPMLEHFGSSVAFLHRHGMKCVIVHGQPIKSEEKVSKSNLQSKLTEMNTASMKLASILELHGAHASLLFSGSGVLQAKTSNTEGIIGSLCDVSALPVQWALQSGHVPIVQSLGQSASGQLLFLDLAETTSELAKAVSPLKVMFVSHIGGITNGNGEVIANVNLPYDTESLFSSSWCTDSMKDKVNFISKLLDGLPRQSSVVITSPQALLTELFTHHGSGTFFKIMEPVHSHESLEEVDCESLFKLIERGFGRELEEDYLTDLKPKLHALYLVEGYTGAAIITKSPEISVPYLDKFVVLTTKQGENVGQMLWDRIRKDFPHLYWRSRNSNHINPWYFQRSEGSWTNGEWTVFWYGSITHKASSCLIDHALSLPSSFKTPGPVVRKGPLSKVAFGK